MEAFISQTKVSYEFPSEIIYEHKFDTAIRDTFLHSFEDRYKTGKLNCKDQAMLSQIPKRLTTERWEKSGTYLGSIIKSALNSNLSSKITPQSRKQMASVLEHVFKICHIQLEVMLANYEVNNKKILISKIVSYFDKVSLPVELNSLIQAAIWFSKVVDQAVKCKRFQGKMNDTEYIAHLKQHNKYESEHLGITIVIGDNIILIYTKENIWVCPYVCLLQIHNKMCDIISVLVFSLFSEGASLPENAYTVTVNFIIHLTSLLVSYKDKYYTIAKSLESLCIAETIIEHEEWINREFLHAICDELYEDTNFDYLGSELRMHLTSVTSPFRHQLCCLSKIIGHPYVDMHLGAKSLFEKTTEVYKLNMLKISQCINHIKLNYIRNHIVRYNKWPPSTISYGAPSGLTTAYVTGRDPMDPDIKSKSRPTTVDDMVYIQLNENSKYHKLENVIPYLKDKTVSLLRKKIVSSLLENAASDWSSKWEETRLILAYLLNPSLVHDHVSYIEKYDNADDLRDFLDYLVIRIVPKEKELKISFRGFGCKTYEDRMRALSQEKNVMMFLDEFSDEQAMTLNELEIIKRLNTFRHLYRAYPSHKILYVNIDASSWNNHFRSETVDFPMKHTLDKVFNTSIFGKTHEAYKNTLMYIPNQPTAYYWDGQAGGIEGLNQDTWVLVYIGQIKTALETLEIKYHILCKGDDLRLVFAVPPQMWRNRNMSDIKNDIVSRLASTMKDFGHKIKILESYGSSVYFAFSKSASIGSIELPQGYRKIQKCYGSNNALIATLDEYIASTFSNAHSSCKVEPNVLPSYLTGLFWSVLYLINHPVYKDCTNDEFVALLLTPSLAGGFPIIYLHNMAVRAESDLLSPYIHIYNHCKQHHPSIATVMENMMRAPQHMPGDKLTMLYKDPYSIPNDRPQLPSALLRSFIIPILKRYVRNEDVKELLRACDDPTMELLHSVISSADPLHVKVLSALFAATPQGILDELVRKFESARSINELMLRTLHHRRSVQVLRKIVRAEKTLQAWRLKRLRGSVSMNAMPYTHLITDCPSESAFNIRRYLWGKDVIGITMPPLQHQVVIMTAFAMSNSKWVNENHFTYTVTPGLSNIDRNTTDHYTGGGCKPFLGYTTRSGMTEPTVHFIEKDPMLQKIKNLLSLMTWTNTSCLDEEGKQRTSNCSQVICSILGTFTSTPIEKLAPFSGVRRSGTIQHHVRAPSFRESIVPNVLSTTYTRVVGESNSHIRYRTSKDHFYVNFLHIYCYSVWMMMLELEFSSRISTPAKVWTVTSDCQYCNKPIKETPIIFNTDLLKGVKLHPLALSTIGSVAETILQKSLDNAGNLTFNIDNRPLDELPAEVAIQGVMQEIINQTYHSRHNVMIRYDLPHITEEAYSTLVDLVPTSRSRNIGQTEIKHIPIQDLVNFTILVVIHHFKDIVKRGNWAPRDILISTTPGDQLPWFGLLSYIHTSGRLPEFISYIRNVVGTADPTCYYNPITAARYVGRHAQMYNKTVTRCTPIVILSYYTDFHIIDTIERCLIGKTISCYNKLIKPYLPKDIRTELLDPSSDITDGELLFAQSCIFCTVLYNVHDIAESIATPIIRSKYLELVGLGIDMLNDVMVDDFLELDEDIPHHISDILYQWSLLGYSREQIKDRIMWEEMIDAVLTTVSNEKTEIHYTNIGVCCLKVRSIRDKGSETELFALPENLTDIPDNPEHMMLQEMDRPCVIQEGTNYVPAMVAESCFVPNYNWIKGGCMKIHDLFRIHGAHAGSESNLLAILLGQGLSMTQQSQHIFSCCLADGHGGFSRAIKSVTQYLTIVFHSLPEDQASPIKPFSLDIHSPYIRLLSQHLDEGYISLYNYSTIERIMTYNIKFDILTSDLEVSDDNLMEYRMIQLNILQLYLMTRARQCFIIMKHRVSDHNVIRTCYDVLSHFCLWVGLVSPRSNNSSKYVYMLGRGFRKTYDAQIYLDIVSGEHSTLATKVMNTYYRQLDLQWKKKNRVWREGLDASSISISYVRLSSYYHDIIPLRILSLIQSEFSTSIQIEQSSHLTINDWKVKLHQVLGESSLSPPVILNSLGFDIMKLGKHILHQLKECSSIDTSTRRLHLQYTRAKMVGLISVLKTITSMRHPIIISDNVIQEEYQSFMNKLKARDVRGYTPQIHWSDNDWENQGMTIHYNTSFQNGITCGLSLIGTMVIEWQLYKHVILSNRNDSP